MFPKKKQLRKMKRIKYRDINPCSDCQYFRFCPMRLNDKVPELYECHSEIKTIRLARKSYDKLVLKARKLRKLSYSLASRRSKKWILYDVLGLIWVNVNEFNPYKITYQEAVKIIDKIRYYI